MTPTDNAGVQPAMRKCPGCSDGMQVAAPAKIDQSGSSYLPALAWSCDKCQRVDTVRTGEPWKPYLYDEPGLPPKAKP